MKPTAPALCMAAGAALLLLLLPGVAAQVPAVPSNPSSLYFRFMISCGQTYVDVDFLGAGEAECTAIDMTYDSAGVPGTTQPTGAIPHRIDLKIVGIGSDNETQGWKAQPTLNPVNVFGLSSVPFGIRVTMLPTITSQYYRFLLLANYTAEDGSVQNFTVPMVAHVKPYGQAFVAMQANDISKKAGQNERITYSVDVRNDAVYPEYYNLRVATSDPTFYVAQPAGVYVPPQAERQITFEVLTPKGSIYQFGQSAQFTATLTPTFSGGSYTAVGLVRVTGFYLPVSWIPMALLGIVSATIVVRRARETAAARRLERGAPGRVQPTPRQAVLLAELKRADPEAYAQRKAQLDALYAQRRGEYKSISKERRAHDRAESRLAAAEFRAARKRQAAERKATRTQAARERKEAKILEAREAKARKAKEKELKRARRKLGKQQAKLAKKEAKAAKKQAKTDAKQAKKDAKAAKKAARAAKKAAKKKGE